MHSNNCPVCERLITDCDPKGCESTNGQRYCIEHLNPEELKKFETPEW